VCLLDSVHAMDDGARVANDQVLMTLVSICVLHERFHVGEGFTAKTSPLNAHDPKATVA
jgi:hypothetical protein